MNQKNWFRIVSIYSILYTVITLLSSVLYLCSGIYEDPSGNWHELDRANAVICAFKKKGGQKGEKE